jgi:hypothetical protein
MRSHDYAPKLENSGKISGKGGKDGRLTAKDGQLE